MEDALAVEEGAWRRAPNTFRTSFSTDDVDWEVVALLKDDPFCSIAADNSSILSRISLSTFPAELDAMFIPRDTFWLENARCQKSFSTNKNYSRPVKQFSTGKIILDRPKNSRPTKKFLDRQKKFSTGQKILDRQKSFSTGEKYSRPIRKFSTDKKNSLPTKSFSTGGKYSRPAKKFSTHEHKSRKVNINSERMGLHLARWNDIWAYYPKNWILKIISTTFVHYGFP